MQSEKFHMLGDATINREPYNDEETTCASRHPDLEIIRAINHFGKDNVAMVWVDESLVPALRKSSNFDTSFVVPELSRHNFIGHLVGVIVFTSNVLHHNGFRVLLKNSRER